MTCLSLAIALILSQAKGGLSQPPRTGVILSVYHPSLHGKKMANGNPYNKNGYTVAMNTLPLGTRLHITYQNKCCVVVVADRMAKRFSGKRIDVSGRVWNHLSSGKPFGLLKATWQVVPKN